MYSFEYRGWQFRWVLSPNRFICKVYHESELIGTIPVIHLKVRQLPKTIKVLYPICDAWLKETGAIEEDQTLLMEAARLSNDALDRGVRETIADVQIVEEIAKLPFVRIGGVVDDSFLGGVGSIEPVAEKPSESKPKKARGRKKGKTMDAKKSKEAR